MNWKEKMTDNNAEFKLTRSRIQLQKRNSFFAYLSLFLKFKESKDLPDYAGMGVDLLGNLHYKPEFVEKISDEELIGTLTHEILHLSLSHLTRLGSRNMLGWNLATDIVINSLLTKNGFKLPDGCLIPNNNNEIEVFKKKIVKCDEKIAEEIYNELDDNKQKGKGQGKGEEGEGEGYELSKGDGSGKGEYKQFDKHFYSKGLSEKEKREIEKGWLDKTQEAIVVSKMKGDTPAGIERYFGELHKEKIDWKSLLQRYVTQMFPVNFTWAKPHKKSVSVETYLPDVVKEKIKVGIAIDTSGSIGQEELVDFLSEIIGLARGYQEKMDMVLYTHETDVNERFEVRNGQIEKIKELKLTGGGGTSHIQLFNKLKEELNDYKYIIFFTDGCSDINQINFEDYPFEKIFVISKNGTDEQLKGKRCLVINLKD